MKIILAFDKFKGSLTSAEAAEAAKCGVLAAFSDHGMTQLPAFVTIPTADGGEGTVDAFHAACGGVLRLCNVTHPCGDSTVCARYLLLPQNGKHRTAVLEMAAASGLQLVSEALRDPMYTSTYGTGELLRHALDDGVTDILLGLGGSATNDGGCGMAAALGARFYDDNGVQIPCPAGKDLLRITRIDLSGLDARLGHCHITACCDVDNPLCGEHGAAAVFALQKGAKVQELPFLDAGLSRVAEILAHDYGTKTKNIPGAGAAGGLGMGVLAFLGGSLTPGIDAVCSATHIDAHLEDAALLLTGEGKLDAQTVHGKTVAGLLRRAKDHALPALVFGGCIEDAAQALYGMGAAGLFALCDRPMTLPESLSRAGELLTKRVRAAMGVYLSTLTRG